MVLGKGGPADTLMFFLRGNVNVPLNLSMNWESMTFGYAYRVNKYVSFALNLSRHLFTFDLGANVDIDLLGRIKMQSSSSPVSIDQLIDYGSDKLNGVADGHYTAEAWTPTLGLQLWRFTLTSRFGFTARAQGSFLAKYSVPFFMNEETFAMPSDISTLVTNSDNRNKLTSSAVNNMTYSTDSTSAFDWSMPQGHTISFDLIPERLNLSYTKFFGDIEMNMKGIHKIRQGVMNDTTDLSFDIAATVDNMILLSGKFPNVFFNMGVFAFDLRSGDQDHILGNALSKGGMSWMKMGKSAMMPVLNAGSFIGTKMQLQLELDVLPLPAVKTGVAYYF